VIARITLALSLFVAAGARDAAAQAPHEVAPRRERAPRYQFASIPWLSPADSVSARLAAHGYKEAPGSRRAERRFYTGKLFDRLATVQADLDDQGRLVRWDITIVTTEAPDAYAHQRQTYDDACDELARRYGARNESSARFRFPFADGDGREAMAFHEGLAVLRSIWRSRSGDRLTVAIDRDLSVTLVYETREWAALSAKRKERKAKDL
jgi:hypothetical protein